MHARQALELIQRLRKELHMGVIFVTHDLAVARSIGDRIAVMYLGRILEVGDAEDVIGHAQHPYTQMLLNSIPGVGKVLPSDTGEPASAVHPPSGCAFHPRCPIATEQCARTLQGIQLVALQGQNPKDLDSHFVACIKRGDRHVIN
jgi:peptide/nickel transport system ATP-binding protein